MQYYQFPEMSTDRYQHVFDETGQPKPMLLKAVRYANVNFTSLQTETVSLEDFEEVTGMQEVCGVTVWLL